MKRRTVMTRVHSKSRLMPESCETLKHWAQNFKKSLRGSEYGNWFCGLWKIWYYIIDMTILRNISMSHIKMSTKILYHIKYLNLRYDIWYLYQWYYIFNITVFSVVESTIIVKIVHFHSCNSSQVCVSCYHGMFDLNVNVPYLDRCLLPRPSDL